MKTELFENIEDQIQEEAINAYKKYGHFNSTHEVYGVLVEELEEFFEFVKLNIGLRDESKKNEMIKELIQISAIAKRAAMELNNNKINWI